MADVAAVTASHEGAALRLLPLAMEREARRDRAALAMENAALCRQLRAAGLEPVSRSSDEWVALYERCMAVVSAASALLTHLGTSKEMLEDWT